MARVIIVTSMVVTVVVTVLVPAVTMTMRMTSSLSFKDIKDIVTPMSRQQDNITVRHVPQAHEVTPLVCLCQQEVKLFLKLGAVSVDDLKAISFPRQV